MPSPILTTLPLVSNLLKAKFVGRLKFANSAKVDVGKYKIELPPGLAAADAPQPSFVTRKELDQQLGKPRPSVKGVAKAKFSLAYANFNQQWRQIPTKNGPPQWQFMGGEVYFDSTVSVYILDEYKPNDKDKSSVNRFRIIIQHELEHVLDDADLVRTFMPQAVLKESMVQRYFVQNQPMDNSMFEYFIRGPKLQEYFEPTWMLERNKRADKRDSPEEYNRLMREMQKA
ncbi:hypothetical protein ETAA8_60410 [Anatilimnocola aggregata]|uniref:Uncharacterized protein n=1 Tax=Anatilimnocola aggregata TaxID=2528021 RepID=A0A517YKY8_9BACT|nr:hypothetical protein [Anatilimnocola aggregata]QDU30892.1 hypothetical protein ETAA8_60410 [Anatilimnocola aggregata]